MSYASTKATNIKIIKAMADYDMNVSQVSRMLNYHRNTIDWHIALIKKTYELDPRKFHDLVELLRRIEEGVIV